MSRLRPASRTSYTGRRPERQSPPYFRAAILVAAGLALAGCASTDLDPTPTGSIARGDTNAGVDPSDWETVRLAITEIGSDALDRAWRNPETGSSGTITALAAEPRDGGVCRSFATTVNDVRGIRRYRGEACQAGDASWRITAIIPEDSALL